jgi:hypothetical protein
MLYLTYSHALTVLLVVLVKEQQMVGVCIHKHTKVSSFSFTLINLLLAKV